MKRSLLGIIVFACIVASAFGNGQGEATDGEAFIIRVGYGTAGGPIHEAALEFERLIEEADPRIDVQVFPGGQLGSEGEIIGQLQAGVTDMLPTTTGPLGQINPIYYVLESPYVFLNEEQADRVLDGEIGRQFLDGLEDFGLIGLAFWENGFRQLTNNVRPIRTPEDLDGVRLRVQQNQLHIEYFGSIGASPTPLPFTEIYNALATNVVDGQENPFSLIATNRFYEQQDYVSKSDHVYSAVPVFFSASRWAELPEDVQDLVAATVYDLRLWQRNRGRELQAEYLSQIGGQAEVTELSDAEKARFREAALSSYEWATERYGEEYRALLDRVAAEATRR
ncbi:MAG: DctP family TRAP transporter solute-binding subunit [Spirochaetales bacterium]|nr:DctP family TRAP transporter solute-binding subunit [Spirochaetales bacterium]